MDGHALIKKMSAFSAEELALEVVMDPGLVGVESSTSDVLVSDNAEDEDEERPRRIVIYGFDD